MDCENYDLQQAVVLNNDNLRVDGKLLYAPIYMTMFIEHSVTLPIYGIDLSSVGRSKNSVGRSKNSVGRSKNSVGRDASS
jgi:hypothetical protein